MRRRRALLRRPLRLFYGVIPLERPDVSHFPAPELHLAPEEIITRIIYQNGNTPRGTAPRVRYTDLTNWPPTWKVDNVGMAWLDDRRGNTHKPYYRSKNTQHLLTIAQESKRHRNYPNSRQTARVFVCPAVKPISLIMMTNVPRPFVRNCNYIVSGRLISF